MAAALEAGGEDLRDEGDEWMVTCERSRGPRRGTRCPERGLDRRGLGSIEMVPTTRVEVTDESTAKRVLKLIELLEEHDDVQSVWANFDIPDEILERGRALSCSRRSAGLRVARVTIERVFVLGIDPGLSRCGYGCVRSEGPRGTRSQPV